MRWRVPLPRLLALLRLAAAAGPASPGAPSDVAEASAPDLGLAHGDEVSKFTGLLRVDPKFATSFNPA
jgi:hypothetical protein